MMKVLFWGTYGSIPSSKTAKDVREKVRKALWAARGRSFESEEEVEAFIDAELPFAVSRTYGVNTSCLQLLSGTEEYVLLDAGSGIRDFAVNFMRTDFQPGKPFTFHILMTHLHWDHVQGFPFFIPAYLPNSRIIFHGYHTTIEETFRRQMSEPTFPVPFDVLASKIEFDIQPPLTPFNIGGFDITSIEQNHPGVSYGYRFEKDGHVVVYSTDSEHKQDAADENYRFIPFFRDADVVIFDAQYSLADATFSKADWGHSSNVLGVELASRARAKHLVLYHNEPTASDAELDEFLFNSRMYNDIYHSEMKPGGAAAEDGQFPREITLAYDGLEIDL